MCTLLGPEGPGLLIFGSGGLNLWTLSLFALYIEGAAGGTARTLRTTQWTRAS
jgi:hypothetical protein